MVIFTALKNQHLLYKIVGINCGEIVHVIFKQVKSRINGKYHEYMIK